MALLAPESWRPKRTLRPSNVKGGPHGHLVRFFLAHSLARSHEIRPESLGASKRQTKCARTSNATAEDSLAAATPQDGAPNHRFPIGTTLHNDAMGSLSRQPLEIQTGRAWPRSLGRISDASDFSDISALA